MTKFFIHTNLISNSTVKVLYHNSNWSFIVSNGKRLGVFSFNTAQPELESAKGFFTQNLDVAKKVVQNATWEKWEGGVPERRGCN